MRLLNTRGEREQEIYKMIGETQPATLWAFLGRRLVWTYNDGSKIYIKTSGRHMFSFNKYFPFSNPSSMHFPIFSDISERNNDYSDTLDFRRG